MIDWESKLNAFPGRGHVLMLTAVLLLLGSTGCASRGAKLMAEPIPREQAGPLHQAVDENISVIVDWVIVRDGPGSWIRNADWDEYVLRFDNLAGKPITITGVRLTDSLASEHVPFVERDQLVKASRVNAKRYKAAGIEVKAGHGMNLVAAGAVTTVAGMGAASIAIASSPLAFVGLGSASAGATLFAASGLMLAGPVLAVSGLVRSYNNQLVDFAIGERAGHFPLDLNGTVPLTADLFFPLAPAPQQLAISYQLDGVEHELVLDTSKQFASLHLPSSTLPASTKAP